MIRVTVEVVPLGDETLKFTIGEMLIAREKISADFIEGDYSAVITADDWSKGPRQYMEIVEHPRESSVWYLIGQILNYGMGTRKKPTKKSTLHSFLEESLIYDDTPK